MTSRYDRFADWVANHVMVTLTAARGLEGSRLLAEFGPRGFDQGERTLEGACDLQEPTVRIGTTADGRVYAVGTRHRPRGDPAFLQRLTADGGAAVSLCFTATISTFSFAGNGRFVNGFDITLPAFRYGSDPHAFDPRMDEVGLLTEDGPRPAAATAAFVDHVFGFTITRSMLEDRLPCARVPPIGGLRAGPAPRPTAPRCPHPRDDAATSARGRNEPSFGHRDRTEPVGAVDTIEAARVARRRECRTGG